MVTDEYDQEAKRRRLLDHSQPTTEDSEEGSVEELSAAVRSRLVRDAIESQFSLEILLKHDELRLISQELAKCQTAMEQLRRCHLIPYPTGQGTFDSRSNISTGTGPALKQGHFTPQWAPPYGVADGPYTKHYSKWLIPDFNFDGVRDEWNPYSESSRAGKTLDGRSTRNSIGDGSSSATKSRSSRGTTGQKLQALSSGYPQAKEKAGPCVLKRGDGQWVKLVCIDCQRENFSSTQGFINHCRIAHHREFKSHEEAAVTSGQPVELDGMGGIVGEEKPQLGEGLVHPLIRSAPTDRAAYVSVLSHIDASLALFAQGNLPGVTSIPTSATTTPVKPNDNFVPSTDTPHLSNFMRNRGCGGNLTDMIGDAKTPVDFDELSSHDDDSDEGESQPPGLVGGFDGTNSPRPTMRMPARATTSPAPFGRPGSSKGTKCGISPRMSYATPIQNVSNAGNHIKPSPLIVNEHAVFPPHEYDEPRDAPMEMDLEGPSFVDLSPNTVASNNAPSLVSDDGEYDDGDDAESVTSEGEEEGSDVAEIDIEDGDGEKVVPRTVLRNRSGSGGDGMKMRKEDKHVKHVTFVSPVKEAKGKGRARK